MDEGCGALLVGAVLVIGGFAVTNWFGGLEARAEAQRCVVQFREATTREDSLTIVLEDNDCKWVYRALTAP